MVVGLAAAAAQGAPAVTQDVDLWFRDLSDERIRKALADVGGVYVPPTSSRPPMLAGLGTSLFDVVLTLHGLDSYDIEAQRAVKVRLGDVDVRMLPLERIIASKKAARRPKDLAILPALEDALLASRAATRRTRRRPR